MFGNTRHSNRESEIQLNRENWSSRRRGHRLLEYAPS